MSPVLFANGYPTAVSTFCTRRQGIVFSFSFLFIFFFYFVFFFFCRYLIFLIAGMDFQQPIFASDVITRVLHSVSYVRTRDIYLAHLHLSTFPVLPLLLLLPFPILPCSSSLFSTPITFPLPNTLSLIPFLHDLP